MERITEFVEAPDTREELVKFIKTVVEKYKEDVCHTKEFVHTQLKLRFKSLLNSEDTLIGAFVGIQIVCDLICDVVEQNPVPFTYDLFLGFMSHAKSEVGEMYLRVEKENEKVKDSKVN